MSKQINLDEVFRNRLKSLEEPFDDVAWRNMQSKLASDNARPAFWLPFFNKKIFNLFSIMTLLSLFVTSFLWFNAKPQMKNISLSSSLITENAKSNTPDNALNRIVPATPLKSAMGHSKLNTLKIRRNEGVNLGAVQSSGSVTGVKTNSNLTQAITSSNPAQTGTDDHTVYNPVALPPIVSLIQNLKMPIYKPGKIRGIPETYTPNTRSSTSAHYDCATGAIHLHYLQALNTYAAVGTRPGLGFDLEGYTRNITPHQFYGLFFGGSGSIAWMGRSSKSDIVLNTPHNDPGKTFLRNVTADFNLLGKLEFGRSDIKFYAIGLVGWRGIFVGQQIESTKQIDGFTNSSKNVWNISMLQWGGGAGIRYHFAPGLSFDLRGMLQDADMMRVTNVRQSVYDEFTGKYTLNYNTLQPRVLSIKAGLIFCFDEMDSHVTMEPAGPKRTRNTVIVPSMPRVNKTLDIKLPAPKR